MCKIRGYLCVPPCVAEWSDPTVAASAHPVAGVSLTVKQLLRLRPNIQSPALRVSIMAHCNLINPCVTCGCFVTKDPDETALGSVWSGSTLLA